MLHHLLFLLLLTSLLLSLTLWNACHVAELLQQCQPLSLLSRNATIVAEPLRSYCS